MNFGKAIEALKQGKKITRAGWNGMYLFLLPGATVPIANIHTEPLRSIAEANGGTVECLPAIRMVCADGKVLTGWLASQTDILAEDWRVFSEHCDGRCDSCEKTCEHRCSGPVSAGPRSS